MKARTYAQSIGAIGMSLVMVLALACKEKPTTPQQSTGSTGTKPTPAAGVPASAVQAPQAVEAEGLAVAVRINSFAQVLPKLQALVSPINPSISVDALKVTLGAALNDPTLANLDQTRSIMVCVFDPGGGAQPMPAFLVPVVNEAYKTMFQAQGQMVHQEPGGKTLIIAENDEGMVAARAALPKLEAMMNQKMTNDLSVYVNVEKMMTNHKAEIDAGIQMLIQQMKAMQAMAGQEEMGKLQDINAIQLKALVNLLQDVKDGEFSVTAKPDGVDLAVLLQAKAGSKLAEIMSQPITPAKDLLGYVPGTGAIIGYGSKNTMLAEHYGSLMEQAASAQGTALTPEQRKAFGEIFGGMKVGVHAQAFDFLTAGGALINGVIISQVDDAEKMMELARRVPKMFEESGMLEMYKTAGIDMKMDLKENVRQYAGTNIHEMTFQMTMPTDPNTPPFVITAINTMLNIKAEFAHVGNIGVMEIGTGKLNELIDAVKAKRPISTVTLNAEKLYGPGGSSYADVNVGRLGAWVAGLVKTFMGAMIPPEVDAIMQKLNTLQTKPISFYTAMGKGGAAFKMNIPLDPIVKIKELVESTMAGPPPVAP